MRPTYQPLGLPSSPRSNLRSKTDSDESSRASELDSARSTPQRTTASVSSPRDRSRSRSRPHHTHPSHAPGKPQRTHERPHPQKSDASFSSTSSATSLRTRFPQVASSRTSLEEGGEPPKRGHHLKTINTGSEQGDLHKGKFLS